MASRSETIENPNYKKYYMMGTKWRGRLHIESIRILDSLEAGRMLIAIGMPLKEWSVWEVGNITSPRLLTGKEIGELISFAVKTKSS